MFLVGPIIKFVHSHRVIKLCVVLTVSYLEYHVRKCIQYFYLFHFQVSLRRWMRMKVMLNYLKISMVCNT